MTELPVSVLLLMTALGLAPLGLVVPLVLWARWLRRATGTPPLARRVGYAFLVAAGCMAVYVGRVVFDLGCARLSSAVDRRRVLASGAAEIFYDDLFIVAAATVGALWLLFCTWRWHWGAKTVPMRTEPPYR
jgi:hypothetical protein